MSVNPPFIHVETHLPIDFDWLNELNQVEFAPRRKNNPVQVGNHPANWKVLGSGNYAAVFCHEDHPSVVVKMRVFTEVEEQRVCREFDEEVEVYRKIGEHDAFSALVYAHFPYLILKRLAGKTMLQMIRDGERIHPKHIRAVNRAIGYARTKGLHPHDVHIKNIMISKDHVYIADISDFLQDEYCRLWDDSQRFYWGCYILFIYPFGWPISQGFLEKIKLLYRKFVPYAH